MSLKRNIIANYLSQFYVMLIGIGVVPLYIKYMGAEAYGLIGFYSMLQSWFSLLDMGLTPTISRETARFRGGATDAPSYRRLVRALEGVFLLAALAGGAILFAASGYIANDWLKASLLPKGEVQTAVQLMVISIALRWMCGLHRGAISGSERLVWLGGYNSIIATLRFAGVLPLLIFVGVTPTIFFIFQLVVAVIEFAGLLLYSYRLLPDVSPDQRLPWAWTSLKPVLKFSLIIAFTSSIWVLVTQTDKLVLSSILSLTEYGYFTLAVLVAGAVMLVSAPISSAILPRMTRMNEEGDETELIRLYRNATQLVAVITFPTTFVLALFAEQVLWAWTGDRELVGRASPVLALYALGNGILVIGTLCYYFQLAKGDLKLHLVQAPLFIGFFLPNLFLLTTQYGSIGAGYAWLGTQVTFFILWVPVIHRRFVKKLHFLWLYDLGKILGLSLSTVLLGYVLTNKVTGWPVERLPLALVILFFGTMSVLVSAMGVRVVREEICRLWLRCFTAPLI